MEYKRIPCIRISIKVINKSAASCCATFPTYYSWPLQSEQSNGLHHTYSYLIIFLTEIYSDWYRRLNTQLQHTSISQLKKNSFLAWLKHHLWYLLECLKTIYLSILKQTFSIYTTSLKFQYIKYCRSNVNKSAYCSAWPVQRVTAMSYCCDMGK